MTRITWRTAGRQYVTEMASFDAKVPVRRMAEAAAVHAKLGMTPALRNPTVTRVLDLCVALVALCVTLPLYPLIMFAIRIDSEGPVLFRQVRIGKDGYPFIMYKFRTMRRKTSTEPDPLDRRISELWMRGESFDSFTAHLLDEPLALSPADSSETEASGSTSLHVGSSNSNFKLKNDPRITRVGLLLRKMSVDELPQFLNVVRGEMSVVGPRPPVIHEFDRYDVRDLARLLVKPGITGLWQVEGRGQVGFHDMIEMDLRYVTSNSLRGDIAILLRTVPAVLTAKGAS